MLAAVLLLSETGSHIARPLVEMDKEKILQIIEVFLDTKGKKAHSTVLHSEIGTFFYQDIDELSVIVLADKEDRRISDSLKTVEVLSKSLIRNVSLESNEIFLLLSIIDEIFTKDGVINRSVEEITRIINIQSNDEILHEMIMKGKEKEMEKAAKMRKLHPAIDEITKEMEEIRILKKDLKEMPVSAINSRESKAVPEVKRSKPLIEKMNNGINLVTQQKHTATINSETEAVKAEGVGELLIRITDEEYSNISIDLNKSKPRNARAHPSVDKKEFSNGRIVPKTDIPCNTTLTLMKWALDEVDMPIDVSFWQTEVSEERYKFFIEITATADVKKVIVKVPIKRVSDMELLNGKVCGDYIIGEIEDLSKDESKSVEFSGLCDNTDSLFPFHVEYTVEESKTLSPLKITSVHMADATESDEVDKECITMATVIEGDCTVTNN
ncbi:coatomer subunit delta [Nematocida parisii]|nr:coatomer subunit delta [Nematocida parisii]